MKKINRYELFILEGTLEYVLLEVKNKYPSVNIAKEYKDRIIFESEKKDIKVFRNLYSPIGIENEQGIKLDLSKREWRKEYVPAGINPSLAYLMCMIANLKDNDIVYDPFCGSGVLPISAFKYFNIKKAICSDISGSAVEKCKNNFNTANIDKSRYMIFRSDINDVYLNKRNIDLIISNLPFGIRVGNHTENISSYIALENLASKVLRKKGRLILLTQEKKLIREIFKKGVWSVKSVLEVNEGGLRPEVFRIERTVV